MTNFMVLVSEYYGFALASKVQTLALALRAALTIFGIILKFK